MLYDLNGINVHHFFFSSLITGAGSCAMYNTGLRLCFALRFSGAIAKYVSTTEFSVISRSIFLCNKCTHARIDINGNPIFGFSGLWEEVQTCTGFTVCVLCYNPFGLPSVFPCENKNIAFIIFKTLRETSMVTITKRQRWLESWVWAILDLVEEWGWWPGSWGKKTTCVFVMFALGMALWCGDL